MPGSSPANTTALAEQGFWYGDIVTYVQILLSGNSIQIFDEHSQQLVTLDNNQGWEFVAEWAVNNNFSYNKKYSRRHQAKNLLADIANRQELEKEAAKSFNSLRQIARTTPPPTTTITPTTNQLWKDQIKLLEAGILGKLSDSYATSRLLNQIGNPTLAMRVGNILAANPEILGIYERGRTAGGPTYMARVTERVHDLIVESDPLLEPLASTLMSDQNEYYLEEALGKAYNEAKRLSQNPSSPGLDIHVLQTAATDLRRLTQYGGGLTAISEVLHHIPPEYISKDVADIDIEFRKLILEAAGGTHVSGEELIEALVRKGTISQTAAERLAFLAPQLELVEIGLHNKLRHPKNIREKISYNLAASLGIDPSILWIKEGDLKQATTTLVPPGSSLELELQSLLGQQDVFQDRQKLQRLIQLNELHDRAAQFEVYHSARRRHSGVLIQDVLNKGLYQLNVIREPYEEIRRRIWAPIEKVDDFVRSPFRGAAEYWQGLIDGENKLFGKIGFVAEIKTKTGHVLKIPLLNLPGFVADQYRLFRLNLGTKTFEWSWKLAQKGGVWKIFKPISNYSWSFVQHGGDFREANSYFIRKGMGNFLDWGAQRFGFATFAKMKGQAGEVAFALGNKITGGLLGKATAYLASIGLSVEGIGLVIGAITIAIDLTKMVFGLVKKFFTDENFRNKILTWAPAIGLTLGSIGLFISGIPAALAFGFMTILGILEASLLSLAALFVSALVWASITIMSLFILYFGFLLPSTQIDPGTGYQQLVANIVCDTTSDTNNPAVAAVCIADYLIGCKLNPLTASLLQSSGWKCLLAQTALNSYAKDAIELSTSSQNTFQCVGMAAAYVGQAFNMYFPQINAKDYANNAPNGFKWTTSCKDGALFVDTGGTFGHIGVVVKCGPANIVCVDTNYGGPGVTRNQDTCRYDTSKIAGYLVKM
jgi:surface antigen